MNDKNIAPPEVEAWRRALKFLLEKYIERRKKQENLDKNR